MELSVVESSNENFRIEIFDIADIREGAVNEADFLCDFNEAEV
jgi:hypothetical protein